MNRTFLLNILAICRRVKLACQWPGFAIFLVKLCLTLANSNVILRSKGLLHDGYCEGRYKNHFPCIASSIMYRSISNQDQNYQRPIPHISSNTCHQEKCFVIVIFLCNCLGGPLVTEATGPCPYLLK